MSTIDSLHVMVMAGGSGSRFWPRSRHAEPKQFLPLAGDRPLLTSTVERVEGLVPRENIWVLTRRDLRERTAELLPWLDPSRLVTEPEGRDTAPCLVYAGARVARVDPNALLLVLPADHVIPDAEAFRRTVRGAIDSLEVADGLVTFGIAPTFPATGYGYIQRGPGDGIPAGETRCHPVARFREKPDRPTAERYLEAGGYLWNAGIFLWRVSTFRDSLRRCDPDLASGWDRLEALGARVENDADPETEAAFRALRRISIDFALLEHADNVRVVSADFGWDDVGSWRALERYLPADDEGNIADGAVILEECHDSTVLAAPDRTVAVLGVDGLVVVDTPDALLICPRERVEEVKKLVDRVREHGWDRVL